MPSTGLRPEPVLPVMPVTNRRVSVSPSASKRHAGEQRRGREATRMRDVRSRRFLQMLGDCAGELANSRRRAVRMLVHGFVGSLAGIAKVRGNIHAMHARARCGRGCQQPVDDGGRYAVRRRRKQRATRVRGESPHAVHRAPRISSSG